MMKLIITRHGETIENLNGILQGHNDGTLSDDGIEQATLVAKRLSCEKIDVIYSSDLGRAVNTAKEISKYHPNAKIYFVKELREMNLGSLIGKLREKVDLKNKPKDCETREEMFLRAKKFLDYAYSQNKGKTVLFVAHNGINKAIIANIMNKDSDHIKMIEDQFNTAINIFEIKEDKNHIIHLMNCHEHLGEELRKKPEKYSY